MGFPIWGRCSSSRRQSHRSSSSLIQFFLKYVSDSFEARREELRQAFVDPENDYYLGEDAEELIDEEFRDKSPKGKILFIDAREMGEMINRRQRRLTETFHRFRRGEAVEEPGRFHVADLSEIAKHDCILTPGRYVGVAEEEDDGIPFAEKMAKLTKKLGEQFAESHRLENEIRKNLSSLGWEI